jgi:hypothetical protein
VPNARAKTADPSERKRPDESEEEYYDEEESQGAAALDDIAVAQNDFEEDDSERTPMKGADTDFDLMPNNAAG